MKIVYVRLYRPFSRSYISNYKLPYAMEPQQVKIYCQNKFPGWSILHQYESDRENTLDV